MDRDRHKQLTENNNKSWKEEKEKELFKNLRTETNTGANGTQNYVIKEGPNKGKIADKGQ